MTPGGQFRGAVRHCSWKHLLAVKEERKQETETYLLPIFYEMKILEIRKTSPTVSAKVTVGCGLLEAPGLLIVMFPPRCETKWECKV